MGKDFTHRGTDEEVDDVASETGECEVAPTVEPPGSQHDNDADQPWFPDEVEAPPKTTPSAKHMKQPPKEPEHEDALGVRTAIARLERQLLLGHLVLTFLIFPILLGIGLAVGYALWHMDETSASEDCTFPRVVTVPEPPAPSQMSLPTSGEQLPTQPIPAAPEAEPSSLVPSADAGAAGSETGACRVVEDLPGHRRYVCTSL